MEGSVLEMKFRARYESRLILLRSACIKHALTAKRSSSTATTNDIRFGKYFVVNIFYLHGGKLIH